MAAKVIAIVVSWNGRRWIRRCLESLCGTSYPALGIHVVDNGSRDGTPEEIGARFPHVVLRRQRRNLGFAKGSNVGIRAALRGGADYVALLNQDIWVESGWLAPLVEAAEADPRIGIVSPLQLRYEGEALDPNFERILGGHSGDGVIEVPTVIGAAMLVRRKVFEDIGLFDPIYFVYFEEVDFCRRARSRGWRTVVVRAARIHHWHGLLHPNEMPLRVKILNLRNQFVLRLKDPEASLGANLRECMALWGGEVHHCLRHPRGRRAGAARALALAWVAMWLLLNLPRVLYHRVLDRRGGAYL